MRVLLVDDEEMIRKGTIYLLQQMERKVHIVGEAEDGEEGLTKLKLLRPEVAFIDIRMPLIDGLNMVRLWKEKGISPQTRCVILTAYSEFDYAQTALRYGVFDFLLKPLNVQKLEELFEHIEKDAHSAKPLDSDIGVKYVNHYLERHPVDSELIVQIIKYIGNNYMKELKLAHLAEKHRVSAVHISQLFKKATGENIMSFLQDMRIALAKQIMGEYRCKIHEIAYMVGFNDLTYFGRVFKAKTGLTPKEYTKTGLS